MTAMTVTIKCDVYKTAMLVIIAHCFLARSPDGARQTDAARCCPSAGRRRTVWRAHGAADDSGPFPTRRRSRSTRRRRITIVVGCNLDRKSERTRSGANATNCCLTLAPAPAARWPWAWCRCCCLACCLANGRRHDDDRRTRRIDAAAEDEKSKIQRSQMNTPANIHSPSPLPQYSNNNNVQGKHNSTTMRTYA